VRISAWVSGFIFKTLQDFAIIRPNLSKRNDGIGLDLGSGIASDPGFGINKATAGASLLFHFAGDLYGNGLSSLFPGYGEALR
jgi:hypothetical protein